jgi:hypothetical protein
MGAVIFTYTLNSTSGYSWSGGLGIVSVWITVHGPWVLSTLCLNVIGYSELATEYTMNDREKYAPLNLYRAPSLLYILNNFNKVTKSPVRNKQNQTKRRALS